jgi:hypothetical protein
MKGITKLHHFSRKVVDDEGTEEWCNFSIYAIFYHVRLFLCFKLFVFQSCIFDTVYVLNFNVEKRFVLYIAYLANFFTIEGAQKKLEVCPPSNFFLRPPLPHNK